MCARWLAFVRGSSNPTAKFVAERGIARSRPSGRWTTINPRPRPERRSLAGYQLPYNGWYGSTTLTSETRLSSTEASTDARRSSGCDRAARPAASPRRCRPHRGGQLPAAPACRPGSRKPAPAAALQCGCRCASPAWTSPENPSGLNRRLLFDPPEAVETAGRLRPDRLERARSTGAVKG
jgi:hypothetical protein